MDIHPGNLTSHSAYTGVKEASALLASRRWHDLLSPSVATVGPLRAVIIDSAVKKTIPHSMQLARRAPLKCLLMRIKDS